ncbi:MAG TPA: sigma-70 family RNA polymerase sigma factor [Steroidobacteraceae bacterium]
METLPTSERLLQLAHLYISGALQFDYLSNGTGHRQSTPACTQSAVAHPKSPSSAPGHDIARQYLAEVATHKRLSSSEEYCLAVAARNGDHGARQRLIEHQLGLVLILARRYRQRGLPLLDLIEEGNIGLMTAIEKFDPERGCRFSTYAKWWIRQSIELALMTQASLIRVPIHVTRSLKRRRRNGEPPNDTDSVLLDVSHSRTQEAELQAFVDTVAVPEHEQPDYRVQVLARRKQLQTALLQLKHTERLVLHARFGLTNDVDHTLQDIARQLSLSAERVRQIQTEALCKLRRILEADAGFVCDDLL